MPHGTSSFLQPLQFHTATGTGVDNVAVRFEGPSRGGEKFSKGLREIKDDAARATCMMAVLLE